MLLLKTVDDIKRYIDISSFDEKKINSICKKYPMQITDYYLSLVNPKDSADPIRKMCIPTSIELSCNGLIDTSGETENTILPNVQHKYPETVLILSTSKCFMYCRHCFRKRIVGLEEEPQTIHLDIIKNYILSHPTINNVLITGGDAFYNTNTQIKKYLLELSAIAQLDFIRFGTRTPVVYPDRIVKDQELTDMLKEYGSKKQLYVITQFNHPTEITQESTDAIKVLQTAGVVVKNQTVLLKGINDSSEVLIQLLSKLTSIGVIPYYIFQCRPVRGVLNSFQIPLKKGYRIIDDARAKLNGQAKCVRYVLSHTTGKIEILGETNNRMIFKYHEAKEYLNNNRLFFKKISEDQCWI